MKKPDVSTASTEYGTVVLNESTGQYWHLNSSATYILETLNSGASIDDVSEAMSEKFDISSGRAREDATATEQQLKKIGAL